MEVGVEVQTDSLPDLRQGWSRNHESRNYVMYAAAETRTAMGGPIQIVHP